jgi:hypothetical protein
MRISHRHDWSNQNVKDWSVNLASRDPFSLQQFHLGDGDIAVETNIGIGLGRAAAQVAITGVIQSRSLFRASSSRGAVSDQAGTR